jgi:sodium transport system permease protein
MPPLLRPDGGRLRFPTTYFDDPRVARSIVVQPFDTVEKAEEALEAKHIDVLLIVSADFAERMRYGEQPRLELLGREADDRSRLANTQVSAVLLQWKNKLKEARLLRAGLPADYDEPYRLHDPERAKPVSRRAADELFKILGQIFPFVLVMWSLAGALYPAVDVCAGEKERGTMETLLISPASREEIVWGKFLTIWVFSAATALLNLVSMGVTTWWFSQFLVGDAFRLTTLLWGVVLLLPLSAFFSALSLAVGVYARSTKEGQYYLMPLFLITMPLIFLTLAPGVQLNAFYSMVPVTGVALLLQSLIASGTPTAMHALYFLPVLAPMIVYGWLALRWAIEQFQREEVLFREADRLDLGIWLRRLWREKRPLPSAGEAFCCFALILVLNLFTLGAGQPEPLAFLVRSLGFVAAPALLMAVLLTTRPLQGLAIKLPSAGSLALAAGLALLLFIPATQLTYWVYQNVPGLKDALRQTYEEVGKTTNGVTSVAQVSLSVILPIVAGIAGFTLVLAVCEEVAFRGFILQGLRTRFRPWTAILLSGFLFSLYQMNVFQLIPHFLLGTVMAYLVYRSDSVLPGVVFHFVHNTLVYVGLLLVPVLAPGAFRFFIDDAGDLTPLGIGVGAVCSVTAVGLLLLVRGGESGVRGQESGVRSQEVEAEALSTSNVS